jgi:flagellar biosynthesis GTPase FlhF
MLDYGRWQTVLKHTRQSSKPSTVAVLVAMENVCFEQRSKHGGNAFVGSYPFLATMSGVHEDTVRNVVELLETLEVVKVKRNYDVRRKQYSENYYTLLLIGGGGGGGTIQGGVMESEQTSESVALSKEKGEASKCPPLPLRHLDASHKKDIDEALAAKREAAAKYKAEQLATAEERRRQEEAELAERKERERIEREQRLERLKLAAEKEKADKEAAERAEDARRLAMRKDVGSCVAAIHRAAFDEYNAGTLYMLLADYDRSTFDEAVGKLLPDMSDKVRACMKRNEWMFD